MNNHSDACDDIARQIFRESPHFKTSLIRKLVNEIRYFLWRVKRKWFFRKSKFMRANSQTLKFQDHKSIEIAIPVFGRSDLIAACLESIEYSVGIKPSVLIIDNGVDEQTRKMIESFDCVSSYIRNEENTGFGGACDQGIKACVGENIILMNSDIIVRRDAIRILIEDSQINSHIGLCSSVLINRYGRTEEIGRVLNNQGNAIPLFENCSEAKIPDVRSKVIPYSSFACVLVKRSAYEQTNGFDRRFFPAYSEDVDLAIELHKKKFVSVVSVGSRVFHAQGTSSVELSGLLAIKEKNRISLLEKHKDYFSKVSLIDDPYRFPDQLNRARVANLESSKLLILASEINLESISAISEIEGSELILHNIEIIAVDENQKKIRECSESEKKILSIFGGEAFSPETLTLKQWLSERILVFDEVISELADSQILESALPIIQESQPRANFKYL